MSQPHSQTLAGGDAAELAQFGYTQSMERRTGRFASFAVAFAFVSIATGIFTTYGCVLNSSGPVGIWTWPIVVVGQLAVAFAARLAGGADPGDRLCVSVGVAIGQPGVRLDHRMDFVHLLGDRRRRGRLHGRLDGPAVAVRLRGHRRLGLR